MRIHRNAILLGLRYGLLMLLSGLTVWVWVAAMSQPEPLTTGVTVHVVGAPEISFVDAADVRQWLEARHIAFEGGTPVTQLSLTELEEHLNRQPWIHSSLVYLDAQHHLHVHVRQSIPVIRIINSPTVSYYLDAEGRRLPLSDKFTARVPVATRAGTNQSLKNENLFTYEVLQIVKHMMRDSFLLGLIDQIHCNEAGQYELIPFHGKHRILIGDTQQLEEKLSKLRPLYRQLSQSGKWSSYSVVDLRFRHQIYATRRAGQEKTETVQADASNVQTPSSSKTDL
ncbi:MAG: cell division protein FtsQ/DivIB [Chitinophagales bacterium]|nr:cell division protein FtsQ/DivIB [Chitinophagales bacterium]MDW8428737.1 cell division protein FtsQ/DivIB [Chitinophagales bacterium]